MGIVSSDEVLKALSPERQRRIKKRSAELIKEYNMLCDIRKDLGLTQNEVAKALDITQHNVSAMEARSDMKISTLRNYLDALGGELVVSAKFGSEIRPIKSLSTDNHPPL